MKCWEDFSDLGVRIEQPQNISRNVCDELQFQVCLKKRLYFNNLVQIQDLYFANNSADLIAEKIEKTESDKIHETVIEAFNEVFGEMKTICTDL